jgi:hypothetical protein
MAHKYSRLDQLKSLTEGNFLRGRIKFLNAGEKTDWSYKLVSEKV